MIFSSVEIALFYPNSVCSGVYDSPDKHLRINLAEQHYIKKSFFDLVHTGKVCFLLHLKGFLLKTQSRKLLLQRQIPWKLILRSSPIWVNIILQFDRYRV